MPQVLLAQRLRHGNDAIGHSMLPIEVARDKALAHGQQANNGFDAARCARGMAGSRLRRRHGRYLFAENAVQSRTFAGIIVGGSRAVGIHVVDVGRL